MIPHQKSAQGSPVLLQVSLYPEVQEEAILERSLPHEDAIDCSAALSLGTVTGPDIIGVPTVITERGRVFHFDGALIANVGLKEISRVSRCTNASQGNDSQSLVVPKKG